MSLWSRRVRCIRYTVLYAICNYRRSQQSQKCKNSRCFVHRDLRLWPFDPEINGFRTHNGTFSMSKPETSTQKNRKTHPTLFVPRDWPLTFWPQNKWFSRLMVDNFLWQVIYLSCSGFWDIVRKNIQTDKRRWKPYPRDYRRRM